LLREFEQSLKEENGTHNPRAASFFDGVKKFFDGMSGNG
jgi:hypothetical protein